MANGLSQITQNGVDYLVNDPNITNEFSASTEYSAGTHVNYNGLLYRFTTDHPAGAWNASHVTTVKVGDDLTDLKSAINLIDDVVLNYLDSSTITYAIGQVGSDGKFGTTSTTFCGTQEYIYAKKGSIIDLDDNENYKCTIATYSTPSLDGFVSFSGVAQPRPFVMPFTGYVRFSIRKNPSEILSDTSISSHFVLSIINSDIRYSIDTLEQELETTNNLIQDTVYSLLADNDITYAIGQVGSDGKFGTTSTTFCGTQEYIYAKKGSIIDLDDNENYKCTIATYSTPSLDGFVSFSGVAQPRPFVMPFTGYVRFSIRKNPSEVLNDTLITSHFDLTIYQYAVNEEIKTIKNYPISPYFRDMYYGCDNLQPYVECSGSFNTFDQNTTANDFFSAFTTLSVQDPDYITVADMGLSSDGVTHIYKYELNPISKNVGVNIKSQPKIILVSGQHGFEKAMPYGLYYFVRELVLNWENNPVLDYIRNNVKLIILPCMNPYGFDNFVYKNANGVNLNRNYDYHFVVGSDPSVSSYGGASAFSEPETQIVRSVINSNLDAIGVFDLHTDGSSNVSGYQNINWNSIGNPNIVKDPCYQKLFDAIAYNIQSISSHFPVEFNLNSDRALCGHITTDMNVDQPTLSQWCAFVKDTLSITIEGFCGFPDDNLTFTADVQKANAEIILNFIKSFIVKMSEFTNK